MIHEPRTKSEGEHWSAKTVGKFSVPASHKHCKQTNQKSGGRLICSDQNDENWKRRCDAVANCKDASYKRKMRGEFTLTVLVCTANVLHERQAHSVTLRDFFIRAVGKGAQNTIGQAAAVEEVQHGPHGHGKRRSETADEMLNRLLEDTSKPGKGQREKSGTKPPDSTRRSSTAREVGEGVGAMTGAGGTGNPRANRGGPGWSGLGWPQVWLICFFSHGAKGAFASSFPAVWWTSRGTRCGEPKQRTEQ